MDLKVLEEQADAAYSAFAKSVDWKTADGGVLPAWSDVSLSSQLNLMLGFARVFSEAKVAPAEPPPVEFARPPEAPVSEGAEGV